MAATERPDHGLATAAESSRYTRTSYHREVVTFLDRLAERTPHVRLASAGRSGLGQELVYAVASRGGLFTPAAARASGLPIVLVVANIHAGEVEGKEASLMLLRDVALDPALAPLVERAVLVVLPNYNPDGNDRIDPRHRALDLARLEGQIGPDGGVGTRTTGEGWNLNRDYTKQDAVETRCLAALMGEWRPHVVVDCHTTDGSIHGYELTYDTSRNLASSPPGPAAFAREVLLPAVTRRVRETAGFRTWFYGNFRDPDDPTSGWESYPPLARYGSHFRGLLGVVDVLLEAYSYVDFRTRCDVTYAMLARILEVIGERGGDVVSVVERAAADTIARGADPRSGDLVGIDYGTPHRDPDGHRDVNGLSFRHPGAHLLDHDFEVWDDASHRARRIPGRERRLVRASYLGRYEPTATVQRAWGYVVPRERVSALERIASHRLETRAVSTPSDVAVEAYRVLARESATSPDVGDSVRTETVFRVRAEPATLRLAPGDVVVPTAQPWANLATYLLEPHSDDGLARWGHFDDVAVGSVFPIRRLTERPASMLV